MNRYLVFDGMKCDPPYSLNSLASDMVISVPLQLSIYENKMIRNPTPALDRQLRNVGNATFKFFLLTCGLRA